MIFWEIFALVVSWPIWLPLLLMALVGAAMAIEALMGFK